MKFYLRRFRRMAYAFLITALAAAAIFAAPSVAAYSTPDTDTATVKVIHDRGHGSGVHIGDGFIVTAAHVVGTEKTVKVKSKDGQTNDADVLWVNAAQDIALLRTSSEGLGVAHLSCEDLKAGEGITSYGNPLSVEFVAAYGKIAGAPRQAGPWKSVYVTDITTVMGQSGGPVFASNGKLIGITVGVMSAQVGFSGSLVGYGYVVPSSAVCGLLARAA